MVRTSYKVIMVYWFDEQRKNMQIKGETQQYEIVPMG